MDSDQVSEMEKKAGALPGPSGSFVAVILHRAAYQEEGIRRHADGLTAEGPLPWGDSLTFWVYFLSLLPHLSSLRRPAGER